MHESVKLPPTHWVPFLDFCMMEETRCITIIDSDIHKIIVDKKFPLIELFF